MGLKQIPTKIFLEYVLKVLGLVEIPKTGGGTSHSKYDRPDGHPDGKMLRPMSVRLNYMDIPITHIHTNLTSFDPVNGKKDFERWLNEKTGKGNKKSTKGKSAQ